MASSPATLADDLRELVGERLRAVATYVGDDRTIAFLRDDVAPKADAQRVERIHEELVLGGIGGGYQEQLFDLGQLRATVRHFEEGLVVHVAGAPYTGLFVSLDPGAGDRVPAVVDACRAYLRDQSTEDGPLLRRAQ